MKIAQATVTVDDAGKLEVDGIKIVDAPLVHVSHPERMREEWISVEDRLPETKTYALCYATGDRYFTAYFDKSFMAYNEYNFEEAEGVTHWMPLPLAPAKSALNPDSVNNQK